MSRMHPALKSRVQLMATKLSGTVPELMQSSTLVDQDGKPYPDTHTGIYGEIEVNPRTGQLDLKWEKVPREVTVTSVRLVKLDEEGVPYEEVPLLKVPARVIGKGETIHFPITL